VVQEDQGSVGVRNCASVLRMLLWPEGFRLQESGQQALSLPQIWPLPLSPFWHGCELILPWPGWPEWPLSILPTARPAN
jgi:hypothetical protein